ncbi:nuclear transport factor 2 family protein [Bizionia arctica]|uniref:Nuclear transport factor 2 family protein n=1 Tax=Bizionia arctica TaxID=1495645 RepID=A0A917GTT7_9FLAO|nr:nuclear transport factor 2 family protein [Bizionia arctica]GGG57164.1 hypothetical protein GCM10010976_30000 [Bizionia arctica]
MKKLVLIGCLLVIISSCNNKKPKYTQSSEEIEIVKANINDYDYQEWEKLMSHYADTAHIYYNTRSNGLSPNDIQRYHSEFDSNLSTRAFEDENREYEMVEDNNGKTWVNFWGLWKGNLVANNKQIVIPVHITYQFIDNKIVTEYGYWDTSEILFELEKIAAKKATEIAPEKTDKIIEIDDIDDIEVIENVEDFEQ